VLSESLVCCRASNLNMYNMMNMLIVAAKNNVIELEGREHTADPLTQPVTFHSALVPPYVRKTKPLEAALPRLYLKGVSSGEMDEALSVLVGPQAQGLSASTVSRLKQVWADEYRQ